MSRKQLPNPHLTVWKVVYSASGLWAIFTFMNWVLKFLWMPNRYVGFNSKPPSFPPLLTMGSILVGIGWLLLFLWVWWSWQPRRKYARWHRWLASLSGSVYFSSLVLLGGTASWHAALNPPWNSVMSSVSSTLFILAIMLPAFSFRLAQKLTWAQDDLGLKMLSYGTPVALLVSAGIVGANYGIHASRHGEMRMALLIVAFGFSLIAIAVAQYNAEHLWRYRPWTKEEE